MIGAQVVQGAIAEIGTTNTVHRPYLAFYFRKFLSSANQSTTVRRS